MLTPRSAKRAPSHFQRDAEHWRRLNLLYIHQARDLHVSVFGDSYMPNCLHPANDSLYDGPFPFILSGLHHLQTCPASDQRTTAMCIARMLWLIGPSRRSNLAYARDVPSLLAGRKLFYAFLDDSDLWDPLEKLVTGSKMTPEEFQHAETLLGIPC